MDSVHNFLFPFRWKAGMSAKDVCETLKRAGWESRGEDWGAHNEKRFFYPQVYATLYQRGGPLVGEYVCPWKDVTYHIAKKTGKEEKEYALRVPDGGIRIKVYSNAVAIFLLELDSRAGSEEKAENGQEGPALTLEDIKDINDYGGRLVLPYCGAEDTSGICADRLWLTSREAETVVAKCDFVERNNELRRASGETQEESARCLLLEELPGLKGLEIRPALDERMYVLCGVVDPQSTEEMIAWIQDPEKEGSGKGKSLYEFVFKDNSGGCSCEDEEMRRRLLKEHVYSRWLGLGTIYGVAAQSMVALTGDVDFSDMFLGHMKGLYTQMCCLALAQKASLMAFQDRCTQLAQKFGRSRLSSISQMLRLRKDFSVFEGQMCFEEISSQEQPTEMFDMLRKDLRLRQELENVRTQMDGLSSIASAELGTLLTWVGIVLAVISTTLAVVSWLS